MKTRLLPIYLAVIVTAATVAHAQDDLDGLTKAVATPAPAAATPKPAAIQQTPQPRAATTTAAPRSTPAPAKPHEEAKPDLSRARIVGEGDLAGLAGQKLSNVYLIGTYKANGEKAGGRTVFTTRSVVLGSVIRGNTRILVHYPKPPDPRTLAAGNSCQWGKDSPLRVERVEQTKDGITAYATDTP